MTDFELDLLDRGGIQGLAGGGNGEAIEAPILIAHDAAVLVVLTDRHPRALLVLWHGVEELDLKAFREFDVLGEGGRALREGGEGKGAEEESKERESAHGDQ